MTDFPTASRGPSAVRRKESRRIFLPVGRCRTGRRWARAESRWRRDWRWPSWTECAGVGTRSRTAAPAGSRTESTAAAPPAPGTSSVRLSHLPWLPCPHSALRFFHLRPSSLPLPSGLPFPPLFSALYLIPVPLPAPETSIVCRGPNPNLNPNLVLASLEQSWAVFSLSSSRSRFLRVTVVVLNSTGVTEHIHHISSSAALAVSDVSSNYPYTSFFYTLSPLPLALSLPSLFFPSFVAFQRQKHPLLVDWGTTDICDGKSRNIWN